MDVRRANVELHVDHLVLNGFRPQDRHAIAAGFESELRQLLALRSLPARLTAGGALPLLQLGSFEVEPGSPPSAIGAGLAQTLFEGLGK